VADTSAVVMDVDGTSLRVDRDLDQPSVGAARALARLRAIVQSLRPWGRAR
jgi:hypothetical protein